MKNNFLLVLFIFTFLSHTSIAQKTFSNNLTHKPRVIVTADPELDDNNSLIRFLLYSSDFTIEGLVYASSQFHWKGDGKGTKFMVPGREYTRYGLNLCPCTSYRWAKDEKFIHNAVDAYAQSYPNLKLHHPGYPTPAYLRSKIKYGNIEFEGDFTKDTEGSNLIKAAILDKNSEPLYITAWGGASTIARALKSIEDSLSKNSNWALIKKKISSKVILLLSGDQDNTHTSYILPHWPEMRYMQFKNGPNYGYGAQLIANKENAIYLTPHWMMDNVLTKGAFGKIYRVWGDGKQMVKNDPFDYFGLDGYTNEQLKAMGYVVWMPKQEKNSWLGEGDTGTFMNLLDNGLNAIDFNSLGGWGGRYYIPNPATDINPFSNDTSKVKDLVISANMLSKMDSAAKSLSDFPNFFPAVQNDFAGRLVWATTAQYQQANHAPVITAQQKYFVKAGETIELKAMVKDPDGDALTVQWWQFAKYKNSPKVMIQNKEELNTKVQVPSNVVVNEKINLILEVRDNAKNYITRYKNIELIVK